MCPTQLWVGSGHLSTVSNFMKQAKIYCAPYAEILGAPVSYSGDFMWEGSEIRLRFLRADRPAHISRKPDFQPHQLTHALGASDQSWRNFHDFKFRAFGVDLASEGGGTAPLLRNRKIQSRSHCRAGDIGIPAWYSVHTIKVF